MPGKPESEPDPYEQQLWKMQAAYEVAADDIATNQRVYDAVEAALGRIAREHYPGLGQWHGEQLRRLADRISRHASNFCIELSDLDHYGHKEK